MSVAAMPVSAEVDDQMSRICDRIAQTEPHERALRTMLVLTHEVLRLRALTVHGGQQTEGDGRRTVNGGRRTEPVPASAPTDAPTDYPLVVESVRSTVSRIVPADSRVLVVSKGDDSLLAPGVLASHFPRSASGGYAGHYPADGRAASDHLDACRTADGEFLVIPSTAYWWLDYYDGFAQHLLAEGHVVHHDADCLVVHLKPRAEGEVA